MNSKDVIYIDVEDDITAIIGKVKAAKEKIVALVPPKRIGVLQSAVNLHLLTRAADQVGKRLVLISSNRSLVALAAAAKIPVAKNLQSKPEMAEIPALAVDDDDDIIDGAKLPVGELAKTADTAPEAAVAASGSLDGAVETLDAQEPISRAAPPVAGQAPARPKTKSGVKVPNFNKFRKKFVLIAVAGALLIAFLVWAIAFAPRATIVIAARTTNSSINTKVTLVNGGATDLAKNTLAASTQQLKQPASLSFDATGKKNVGDKATGTVDFTNNTQNDVTVPAGTELTASGGTVFVLDSSVTISGGTVVCNPFPNCHGATNTEQGSVTAKDPGANSNGASGDLSGAPDGVSASLDGSTAGGTDKMVAVVSKDDVTAAMDDLSHQNTDTIKKKLAKQFGKDTVVVDETFASDTSNIQSSPAIGAEAPDGKAKLAGDVTYTLTGVSKADIKDFLDSYFEKQLSSQHDQRVYSDGADKAAFNSVVKTGNDYTANIVATAQIGPKINDKAIKQSARGKRYGDIQSNVEAINGVENVDIKFWPFWVTKAPNNVNHISIKFQLHDKN